MSIERLSQIRQHIVGAAKTLVGTSPSSPAMERITMFKIPKAEDRQRILEGYRELKATALKDGKPYIVSLAVGEAGQDPRSKGWNVAVKSTFASKEDMDYYDNGCQAHDKFRKLVGPVKEDIMTVWFENVV